MARSNRTTDNDEAATGAGSDRVEGTANTVEAPGGGPTDSGEGAGDGMAIVRRPGDAAIETVEAELVEESPHDDRAMARARREAGSGAELAVRSHPAMRVLDTWLVANQVSGGDAEMAQGDIIAQVLNAQSVDEVLQPAEAIHARDLIDVPLTIHEVKYQRSDYQEGSPFYAVMMCTRHDTDEYVPVTIGAQTAIAQLARLVQLNALPVKVAVVLATKRPTSKGYWPIRLQVVKDPARPNL